MHSTHKIDSNVYEIINSNFVTIFGWMEDILSKGPVQRVISALNNFDKSLKVEVLNSSAKTAKEAASSLNCEVGAIVKSLLLRTEENFILEHKGDKYKVQKYCPHMLADLETTGFVDENDNLVCPLHNWKFNLKTGECKNSKKRRLCVERLKWKNIQSYP